MGDPVHDAVQRLIRAGVRRLEALEVLLLMVRQPNATWEPAGIAATSMIAQDTAATLLEQLAKHGFVEPAGSGRTGYRLTAPAHLEDLAVLRRTYERDRTRVTTEFFACNLDILRDFANAFKLRRSD